MATALVIVKFDEGIQQMEISNTSAMTSFNTYTESPINVRYQSDEIYCRPIFKSGYEIDSVAGATLLDNGVYNYNGNIGETVIFTSKQSGGAKYEND